LIALTGATGALGSRVARLLAAADHDLRLLVRDASRVDRALDAEVATIGGYTDDSGVRSGLAGCDTLLLVSARESADRVDEHRTVIDAAVAADVAKVVYISFQGAASDATFTFARDHWHTERLIIAGGLAHVFLRDCFYLAALAGLAGPDGVIRGPAADGRVAGVSHDDVAAVAARVLVDDQWDNETLDVTGPESLTLAEVAERLSAVSGREVSYLPETEEEAYASRAHYAAPPFEVAGWVTSYQAIASGEVCQVSNTVERVTDRSPQSLGDFLAGNPASWAHLVSSPS
jgi:NAD(P)H dehydrogenase (quinone)